MGEYHQTREYIRIGIDLAERIQGLRMLGYYQGYASAIDLILGNVDSALSNAKKTLQFGEEFELNDVIAMGCRHLADVYTLSKAPQQAIPYYQRGAMEASGHFLGIDNLIRLGYVQAISGQRKTGHQNLAFSLAASQNANLGLGVVVTEYLQSLVYLAEKDLEEAGRLAQKTQMEAQERGLILEELSATKTLALISLNSGDENTAIEQLRYIAQESMSIGMIWLESETLLELEKALHRKGHHDPFIRIRLKNIKTQLSANTKDPCLQEYLGKVITTIDQGYIGTG